MNVPKINIKSPIQFIASGFGSGCMPFAPGTFGTLAAVPLWFLLSYLSIYAYLGVIILSSIFGILICDKASKELGVHDHGGIVWDEFVGFWITMIAVKATLINVILGFILFRLFDIIKPWPIRWADKKVSGGLGIMLDDLIAGIFASIILQILLYLFL